MQMYEWFCIDCGKPSVDCVSTFADPNFPSRLAQNFEYPVGSDPTGKGFYNAQGFGERNPRFRNRYHLGEDWNYQAGGDSDYGAPVYSIGSGIVTQVGDFGGGWGSVLRICHKISPTLAEDLNLDPPYLESLYAHLFRIRVKPLDFVQPGQWVGSIGDANGLYPAHLHFEIRTKTNQELGGGYEREIPGTFLHPSEFLSRFQKRVVDPPKNLENGSVESRKKK
jgi:murein DD-endopeptidase MepM/ murein hydrolase activator NlpD